MDPLALRSLIESTTSCTVDSYMKTYSGIATFFRTKYDPGFSTTDIALVGLPIDVGLTQRTGARHGPREVRNQSCNVLYFNPLTKVNPLALCRVTDIGDVPMAAAFDLETIIDEIRNFYTKLHAAKVVPLTVGGDHSISFPILQALGPRDRWGSSTSTPISMSRNRFPVRRCTTERRSSMRYARASSIPNAPSTSVSETPMPSSNRSPSSPE